MGGGEVPKGGWDLRIPAAGDMKHHPLVPPHSARAGEEASPHMNSLSTALPARWECVTAAEYFWPRAGMEAAQHFEFACFAGRAGSLLAGAGVLRRAPGLLLLGLWGTEAKVPQPVPASRLRGGIDTFLRPMENKGFAPSLKQGGWGGEGDVEATWFPSAHVGAAVS